MEELNFGEKDGEICDACDFVSCNHVVIVMITATSMPRINNRSLSEAFIFTLWPHQNQCRHRNLLITLVLEPLEIFIVQNRTCHRLISERFPGCTVTRPFLYIFKLELLFLLNLLCN